LARSRGSRGLIINARRKVEKRVGEVASDSYFQEIDFDDKMWSRNTSNPAEFSRRSRYR